MRRKRILLIVSGVAIVFAAYSFFSSYTTSHSQIYIGFSAGLSGLKSELGVSGRNGAQLAVDVINSNGGIKGKKTVLLVADDKNDPQAAIQADRYLIENGVRVIVGHMISGVAQATVAQANAQHVLQISPTIAAEDLTGYDDYFIRNIASNATQGKSLALAVMQETAVKRVAAVYDVENRLFAENIINAFKETLAQSDVEIVAERSFRHQSEYKRIIEDLKQNRAEGVLLIASAIDSGMFCQIARRQNGKLQLFAPMWTMTNDFLQSGGVDADGTYLISQIDLQAKGKEYETFCEAYRKKFAEEPTFASVLSYDAAMIAAFGLKAAGNGSVEQIKKAILTQGTFKGLQGSIMLDANGDTQSAYYLYRVTEGVYQKVRKL